MKFEEVLQILDEVIFAKNQRYLKDVEKFVLQSAWHGQTYEEMAKASNYQYTPNYLKHCVGPRFWRLISEALKEDICKTNFRAALERLVQLKEDCQARNSPNRKILATGGENESIKLWNIGTGRCLKTLRSQRLYKVMNITDVTSLTPTLGAVEIDTDEKESWQMAYSWTVAIANYLKDYNQVTIKQVLAHTQPNISNCSKADQMKVSEILRSLGWKKSPQKKRINGISTCYWFRPMLTPQV